MEAKRVVILGAAGRDFHNFNVLYRGRPEFRVVAFTAAQIPNITGRKYPPALAGPGYPDGIPILPESDLAELIRRERVDLVVLSYSDLSHLEVMHKGSIALAAGASYYLPGTGETALRSTKPVVSICAVRTGAGKSPLTRFISRRLRERGRKVVIVRHPMPYGDLAAQAVQRFQALEDLDRAECTIEEREEYEPHLRAGIVVYAGVDYERILRQAEAEADIVIWDGGNNDLPFYVSDLKFVVADPYRAGHELTYHPGEANFRGADVLVISKTDSAPSDGVKEIEASARRLNPLATVARGALELIAPDAERLRGRKVVVVEDGPSVTHGGLGFGAGFLVAQAHGAQIVDPRPRAVGSIAEVYRNYPHLGAILPSMGYGAEQIRELAETIRNSGAEFVVDGSPVDLARLVQVPQPIVRVSYDFQDLEGKVGAALDRFLASAPGEARPVPGR